MLGLLSNVNLSSHPSPTLLPHYIPTPILPPTLTPTSFTPWLPYHPILTCPHLSTIQSASHLHSAPNLHPKPYLTLPTETIPLPYPYPSQPIPPPHHYPLTPWQISNLVHAQLCTSSPSYPNLFTIPTSPNTPYINIPHTQPYPTPFFLLPTHIPSKPQPIPHKPLTNYPSILPTPSLPILPQPSLPNTPYHHTTTHLLSTLAQHTHPKIPIHSNPTPTPIPTTTTSNP